METVEEIKYLDKIKESALQLENMLIHTPVVPSTTLSKTYGGSIYLKLENLQRTGSFKVRGASNKIINISANEKNKGVITCSAGNHAQGVALAASKLGIHSTIVMPKQAAKTKIEATKHLGGEVILFGDSFDEAKKYAHAIAEKEGSIYVSPFDDEEVIIGQGTVGLEIFQQLPAVSTVIVPIGGGGLIAGVSLALKESNPDIKIIGVQAENVHGMISSLRAGRLISNRTAPTLADGCDVAMAGTQTFDILKERIDETILVSELEIKKAILYLAKTENVIAEGAGALSTAAILSEKIPSSYLQGTTVAIVSGGNIDLTRLSDIF